MKRVLILGAGISGLSLAWNLRHKYNVMVAEASDRIGGWIRTNWHEGFLFERGPHSFRSIIPEAHTLRLINELGLTSQLIAAQSTEQYLSYKNTLHKVPNSLWSFLRSPLTRGLLPALWREWRTPVGRKEESVREFGVRRFGADITDRFIDPMVSGIYAGDPSQLCLKSCFPLLHEMEQAHGSLMRGMFSRKKSSKPRVMSLKNGLQSLTDRLGEVLGNKVWLQKRVMKITFGKEVEVTFSDGSCHAYDHIYSTIPAWCLAEILPIPQLKQIRFASVAAVSLGYHKNILPHRGFGYLVPATEKRPVLGVIWDSCVFPQQNRHPEETRVTVMLGGIRRPELVDLEDDQLIALACEAVSDCLPDAALVTRARRAIPQYEMGFAQRLAQVQEACPDRFALLGNSFCGVSINDCVEKSYRIAGN